MLSVRAIKSVKQAANYFFEKDNYNMASEAKTEWLGKGAEALGLRGEVTKQQFTDLLQGKLPNGQMIGKMVEGQWVHRPGFDLTFSAPKSASILAALGQDERILEAFDESVKATLNYVEGLCAQARVTKDGKTEVVDTDNLVIATFSHDVSRKLDPNIHTHAVVMNVTQREDGAWRSLASNTKNEPNAMPQGFLERVFEEKHLLGVYQRSEFAYRLVELGYSIEKTHADGRFEIVGVPKDVILAHSQRGTDIKKFMQEKGLQGAKAAAYAALKTRDPKQGFDRNDLAEHWQKKSQDMGFDAKAVVAQAKERAQQDKQVVEPRVVTEVAREAVSYALSDLAERDTTLSHHRILNSALAHAIGEVTPTQLIDAMHQAIVDRELIPLQSTDGEPRYTTQTLLNYEQDMLNAIGRQSYSVMPMADEKVITKQLAKTLLSQEQQVAVLKLFSSHDRITALEGPTGSGKTWLLPTLQRLAKQQNFKFLVLTPGKAEAKSLEKQGLKTQTVSGFLHLMKELEPEKAKQYQNCYIVIDNANMLSAKQSRDLQLATERLNARATFMGDNHAYLPYSGGSPFELMQKAGLATVHLHELHRQKDSQHVEAIKDTLAGDIQAAFSKLGSRMVAIEDYAARLESMAKHYTGLTPAEREQTLLLLPTRAQVETINQSIRQELKLQGQLGQADTQLQVLLPKRMTEAQTNSAQHYLVDEVVRFREAQPRLGIDSGCDYHVVETDTEHNVVILRAEDGEALHWDPRQKTGNVEVFTPKQLEVGVGEKIRWLHNHKELGLFNGQRLTITAINAKQMVVQTPEGKAINLDLSQTKQRHFEHGYGFTPQQVHFEHPKQVIAHQESQTGLTTQRSFYKQMGQATDTVWLYTDEVEGYLRTVESQTGNRLGAMESILDAAKQTRVIDPKHVPSKDAEQWTQAVAKVLANTDFSSYIEPKQVENIAKEATLYAIAHLSEREAAFSSQALLVTALEHALGEATPDGIEKAMAEAAKQGLLQGGENKQWTTVEAINLEKSILELAEQFKGKMTPIADAKMVQECLAACPIPLSNDQRNAIESITQSKDGTVVVQGFAGVGKTTFLAEIKNICDKVDYPIIGLAPTHNAVREMQAQGIQAQTLDSFLVQISRGEVQADYSKTLFVLDEVSLVGSRNFHDLLSFINDAKSRLVEMGDRHQLASPSAGKPGSLTQDAGITTIHLKEIKRQNANPTYLDGVNAFYQKDFNKAFSLIDEHKHTVSQTLNLSSADKDRLGIMEIKDKGLRLDTLVEDYFARSPERQANTLIIIPSNKDRIAVNILLREGLREQGVLKGDEINMTILVSKNLDEVQKTRVTNYQEGDIVRFNQANKNLGVEKNAYYTVKEIDKKHNLLSLRDDTGKTLAWQPQQVNKRRGDFEVYQEQTRGICQGDTLYWTRTSKADAIYVNDRVKVLAVDAKGLTVQTKEGKQEYLSLAARENQHLEYGYCFTTYKVQGSTSMEAMALQESYRINLTNQKDILTAATRGKHSFTIYTDSRENLLAQIIRNPGDKTSALETIGYDFKAAQAQREKLPPLSGNYNLSPTQASYQYGKLKSSQTIDTQQTWQGSALAKTENLLNLIHKAQDKTLLTDSLKQKDQTKASLTGPERRRVALAQKIERQSMPIEGTLAEQYLRQHCQIKGSLPACLLYHPKLFVQSHNKHLPALIVVAKNSAGITQAVQAVYLDRKTANKINIAPTKSIIGVVKNSLVTLQEGKSQYSINLVTKNPEAGLSLGMANRDAKVQATLVTSNLLNLAPERLNQKLVFCLDNDGKRSLNQQIAEQAMQKLSALGKTVFHTQPSQMSQDYNDVLKGEGVKGVQAKISAALRFGKNQTLQAYSLQEIKLSASQKTQQVGQDSLRLEQKTQQEKLQQQNQLSHKQLERDL